MNRQLSLKIRFLTFISIALLGFVHGYNLTNPYLTPYATVEHDPLTITTFIQYFFANGFLRFRIPILFLISGYLYALYDYKPYWQRTKHRFVTLLVPYFIWSAIGLLITFLLQQFPYTAHIVASAAIDQMGDNRPYSEIGWHGIIIRWAFAPISYQLWFIYVLFVYNVLYPLFRLMVIRFAWPWFILTGFLWATFFNIGFMEGQGLFFFSIGIWLQKRLISIDKEPKWFSLGLCWIFFIGVCCVKTFIAFEFEPGNRATFITLSILYQLTVVSGILAIWFGVDKLAQWWMQRPWLKQSANQAFFMYGLHVPLLVYIMTMVLQLLQGWALARLIAYILVPAVVMIVCISIGNLLRRIAPAIYNVITGGRGV
ncbi:MAG TPA: acyltransferase [Phnomibacter sp.]|nr:acyltransferase [Phnomibacter sp.]